METRMKETLRDLFVVALVVLILPVLACLLGKWIEFLYTVFW